MEAVLPDYWGAGDWWLAGPYAQFNSNSVSFNGDGLTGADIRFVSPHGLQQLDADNGGKSDSIVTLSCDGQAAVQTTVPVGQIVTIQTGWTAPCTTVSFTSSNGWYTNFANFRLE